ncbi:TIGR03089 family protein [Cellulomonas sp. KRMCY2]|uniref:TIGR03089 family protein n=1 Tax=Cellulomonas sp. KRMCY2 TaxID=1304865 RepID=UPI00045EB0E9|nr:TIGR03089 family protein [Cellulomonas sp. KRMCY2]
MASRPSRVPVPALLARLTADPGRPRLTWYGSGGERIELSGHVLDNWVTKTVNLLVEEYEAGPGTRVLVDLPAHWRAVVWSLAVWRVGATVVLLEGEDLTVAAGCDVVVTHRPTAFGQTVHPADLVAVALPALARAFDGDLPVGATDAAAAVMTYGDVLTWVPEPDPAADALVLGGRSVAHQDLLDWAAAGHHPAWAPADTSGTRSPRLLIEPPDGAGGRTLATVLAAVLSAYGSDGSVVLLAADVVVELATDAERRRRLVEGERVTSD